ncbi:hypothetical protein H0H92_009963 [Tricholoma furcatifolium]|nr:hypothetical protein H0H92_009963 [Tricholoma furcatifolium]
MRLWQNLFSLPSPSTNGYGLSSADFADLLVTEYPALTVVHLDHAASPPPPISAISAFTSTLTTNLYSNPHSHVPTNQAIDAMRSRVMHVLFRLSHKDQEHWDLVWTSGTTASLKIIAEHFPWSDGARYRYLRESHTSLVGIRACALAGGADVESLDLDTFLQQHGQGRHVLNAYPAQCNVTGSRLGLHPARSLKKAYPEQAVLVDAAAYLSTTALDLSSIPHDEAPDFVAGSFYKIYGHPTGLGFLLIKRSSAHFLTSSSNTYFGGGAIEALSVSSPYWVHPRGSKDDFSTNTGIVHHRFENGTIPYLSIVALRCAIDAHQRLFTPRAMTRSFFPLTLTMTSIQPDPCSSTSLDAVHAHSSHLAAMARTALQEIRHFDGTSLVRIHQGEGSGRWEEDGPTIAFTLYTPSQSLRSNLRRFPGVIDAFRGPETRPMAIGHVHVLNLATVAGIHLRTGGLCNTGVLARVCGLSDAELGNLWAEGRVCGDGVEFGGDTGDKGLGLVRVSFGACSFSQDETRCDAEMESSDIATQNQVEKFAEKEILGDFDSENVRQYAAGVYLESLVRYPIKSCAGQTLSSSRVTPRGLLHDREFAIVSSTTGTVLSQKQIPRMVLIRPSIGNDGDVDGKGSEESVMRVRAVGMPELVVPLTRHNSSDEGESVLLGGSVAGMRYRRTSDEADEWVSKFLGMPCQLCRIVTAIESKVEPGQRSGYRPSCTIGLSRTSGSQLTLAAEAPGAGANESAFTLISASSVNVINSWIASGHCRDVENGADQSNPVKVYPSCFRANFVLSSSSSTAAAMISPGSQYDGVFSKSSLPPFHEDTLSQIRIGAQIFQVLARCKRCLVICVDPETGLRMREPFCCLARNRKRDRVELDWNGGGDGGPDRIEGEGRGGRQKVEFGVHLRWKPVLRDSEDGCANEAVIRVGDRVGWTAGIGEDRL